MKLAYLLPLIAAFASWLITGWVRRRAAYLNLLQAPNTRSSHDRPTPNGGGLGVALVSLPIGIWLCATGAQEYAIVSILAALIAFTGLWDDLRPLPKRVRLTVQLVAVALLAALLSLFVSQGAVVPISWALTGLLIIAGVWWINLFNFMDGIDGIAASQAIFMLSAALLASVFMNPSITTQPTWLWMLAINGATVGFLWHNWAPARIFMGDIGSTYLAFMIFGLALISVREGWLTFPFWFILAALFVSDASLTLLRRMLTGQDWLQAHRSHAYQRLARKWGSHARASLLAIAINLIWLAPLAALSLARPTAAWALVGLAYAPLLIGVAALGAGERERPSR